MVTCITFLWYTPIIVGILVVVLMVIGAALSLMHLIRQRPDAYMAAEKLTKPAWALILGCILAIGAFMLYCYAHFPQPQDISFVAFLSIAVIVYWVDVRPSVNEIQR